MKYVLLPKIQPDSSLTIDRVENTTFLKMSFRLTRATVPRDAFGANPAAFYSQQVHLVFRYNWTELKVEVEAIRILTAGEP